MIIGLIVVACIAFLAWRLGTFMHECDVDARDALNRLSKGTNNSPTNNLSGGKT